MLEFNDEPFYHSIVKIQGKIRRNITKGMFNTLTHRLHSVFISDSYRQNIISILTRIEMKRRHIGEIARDKFYPFAYKIQINFGISNELKEELWTKLKPLYSYYDFLTSIIHRTRNIVKNEK